MANFGYQDESPASGDNYISTGVNWGYSASQLAENIDPGTILAIAAMLLLIVFTGYLIIYNVFQISVANDIHFYGLLKTIGTTPSQISRMIRLQALLLSLLGIRSVWWAAGLSAARSHRSSSPVWMASSAWFPSTLPSSSFLRCSPSSPYCFPATVPER